MPNYSHTHRCNVGYHDWECKKKDCYGEPVGTRKPSKTHTCPECSKQQHGEPEQHESYGMISLSRFSSSGERFFGSSITSSGGMHVEISTASKIRNLNSDRYHQEKYLIRVKMSQAQFAQLITSPNSGGVPCTLVWYNGKQMEEPPHVAVRQQFVNEFEDKVKKAFARLIEVTGDIEQYFKTGKGSRAEIRDKLKEVQRELADNAPFILEQFNRNMDKIVTEAKSEVESFTENKIRSLGIKALAAGIDKALHAPAESEPLQLPEKKENGD